MKLNRKWLNEEFVDLSGVPDREFVETMTIAGQKVETYERLDAELRNVVVGRVVSITRHTNSDHMWVCQIDVGAGEPVQIVAARRRAHHKGQAARRGIERHALLPEGARPDAQRLPLCH